MSESGGVVALRAPTDRGDGQGRIARDTLSRRARGTGNLSVADERALVVAAKQDLAAFEALYLAYVDRVYAFLYRRSGCPDVAEEMTAETFESALRSVGELDPDGVPFGPWLFRVASNRLVDYYRRERRSQGPRGQLAYAVLASGEPEEEPGEATEAAVAREAMLASLAFLRPRYRQALELRFLSGLSTADAAAAMGCSKAVLAVTVHRALDGLRREMARGDQP